MNSLNMHAMHTNLVYYQHMHVIVRACVRAFERVFEYVNLIINGFDLAL